MKINENLQDQLDLISDHFDFNKINKVMEFLNWGWMTASGKSEIPDESTIRSHVRQNLLKLIETEGSFSTGGFEYIFNKNKETEWIELSFVIEEISPWGILK